MKLSTNMNTKKQRSENESNYNGHEEKKEKDERDHCVNEDEYVNL